jgi:hypothetical protein
MRLIGSALLYRGNIPSKSFFRNLLLKKNFTNRAIFCITLVDVSKNKDLFVASQPTRLHRICLILPEAPNI